MPIPRFSRVTLNLPIFNRYFKFLKPALESFDTTPSDIALHPVKYFTVPLEVIRKRNYHLASQSCIKISRKIDVSFDLIHAHFLGTNGFVGTALKQLHDIPFVLTVHGSDVYYSPFKSRWHNNLARYVLKKADRIITVSKFNAEKLLLLGASFNKLHIIQNGYNNLLFKPLSLETSRKQLRLPKRKRILLIVGNLINIKGHKHLIEAMTIITKKRSDVVLVIVGEGRLKTELQKITNRLGLNKSIIMIGSQPHERIPLWMNAADIFVLPSLSEGFPTVIPEAMACGKPVISTNVGGIPEAVSDKDLGILVNPQDTEALASAILVALEKTWEVEIITNHARQYSWSRLTKKILEVYRAVL